jgi:hypothetical protein
MGRQCAEAAPRRASYRGCARAGQFAPILLLDLLGKRSQKLTILMNLRAQLLRQAGASDVTVSGLQLLGETSSISSVIRRAARRQLQRPRPVAEWMQQRADCATSLVVDDFPVLAISRAPSHVGSTSAAHRRTTPLRLRWPSEALRTQYYAISVHSI